MPQLSKKSWPCLFITGATLGVATITALGSFIVIACGLIVGMTLLLYALTTVVGILPLLQFARTVAPVQVIGFRTRSSLATLPATIAATEKLGIPSKISGIVLPIAVTLFKFASPIGHIAGNQAMIPPELQSLYTR